MSVGRAAVITLTPVATLRDQIPLRMDRKVREHLANRSSHPETAGSTCPLIRSRSSSKSLALGTGK